MFRFPFLLLVSFDLFLGAPYCPPPKSYATPNHILVGLAICENPPEICATTDGSLVLFLFYYFFPIFPCTNQKNILMSNRDESICIYQYIKKNSKTKDMVLTFIDMHKCVIVVKSTLIRQSALGVNWKKRGGSVAQWSFERRDCWSCFSWSRGAPLQLWGLVMGKS